MRKAGVLLHISSLPGPFGCGTFGKFAYRFADFLAASGFTIWQVLPFNLPHSDGCPYYSASTFVQNPLFIDPEILLKKELLTAREVREISADAGGDFATLAQKREKYLRLAAKRFTRPADVYGYLAENPNILQACRFLSRKAPTEENLFYYGFIQYEFFRQWDALHRYVAKKGIEVIGDIPYYVNLNSSEVYCNPECFLLKEDGQPEFVSGVPSSWPGYNLTIGSSGDKVRQLQTQLNRIARNYPALPTVTPDGVYGPATAESVRTFQDIFNLPQTGVTDYATWYEISEIYVGVSRIAELS